MTWPAELPVTHVRVARPTDKLDEVVRFYAGELGLPELDRFSGHAGYDGVMLGLPDAEHHLEFTAHGDGSPRPAPSAENLLVLYLGDRARFDATVERLRARHLPVALDNPYWAGIGAIAFEDPDGWRVVLVPGPAPLAEPDVGDFRVATYTGPREDLRALFELAEDSPAELDSYLYLGRVLVAVRHGEVIGHLQLVDTDRAGRVELKSMAVREPMQGRGVGRRLVEAAVELVAAESASEIVVATASADIGNLRFYQRLGFRMRSVQRDAFSSATGYPPDIHVDGIPLRDRVWLDRPVGPEQPPERPSG
jgi:GNAT superfamily N-acetyltransferase